MAGQAEGDRVATARAVEGAAGANPSPPGQPSRSGAADVPKDTVAPASGRRRTRAWRVAKWLWAFASWPIVGPATAAISFHRYMTGPRSDEHSDVIKAPAWSLGWGLTLILGTAMLKQFLPEHPENKTAAFLLEILPVLVGEIGVAMIVAYIIARAIDTQARQIEIEKKAAEQKEQFERQAAARKEDLERERRMTQDVFTGVLGIAHDPDYVARVIETTLNRKVIRKFVTLMYTLARVTKAEADEYGIEHPDRFMFLDQAVAFEFENLSADKVKLPVKFVVPARHGHKLRAASRLLSIMFDGQPQQVEELNDDANADSKIYTWDRELQPFKTLSVAFKSRVVKEDSDTDVWCSYYPCTEGMSLLVNVPAGLKVGVRNNTSSKLVEEIPCGDDGMGLWKFDGPILPNNTVVFYWKTREHDGDAPVPSASATIGKTGAGGGDGGPAAEQRP